MRCCCVGTRVRSYRVRRLAAFYPCLDRAQRIELVRSDAAVAMLHARDQEQSHARFGLLPTVQGRRQRLIEHDRARRGDRRVTGAMIDDHLAPLLDERQQLSRIFGLAWAHGVIDQCHQAISRNIGVRIDVERGHGGLRPKTEPEG